MSWPVHVLTIFPEMFPGALDTSLVGKALENQTWTCRAINLRDFAEDKHHSVDDEPFGGGAGMLMRADVIGRAVDATLTDCGSGVAKIYLSPKGKAFTQKKAMELSKNSDGILMLCGRFEGVDQRVIDYYHFDEISIGDFVMTGGEIAAYCMIDACVRLLPDVIGKVESLEEESFSSGLLEYPHYTRPQEWKEMKVPEVLLSGHHEHIRQWRLEQSKQITQKQRPDLWAQYINERKLS
jgi:tRNA (guanine37-N1)-methyltransferase